MFLYTLTFASAAPTFVRVENYTTSDSTPTLRGLVDDPDAQVLVEVAGQSFVAVLETRYLGDARWSVDGNLLPPLGPGTYGVEASVVGTSVVDATTNELTVDPSVPNVGVDDLTTSDPRPALSGTVSSASASVMVTVGGQTHAATNNGDGTWILADDTINPALADGRYNVQASAGTSGIGTDNTVDELTIHTSAPTVTIDPLLTSAGSPGLTGTVDQPSVVLITVNGQLDLPATVDPSGSWQLAAGSIAPGLPMGTYDVVASGDGVGGFGVDNTTDELVVDPDVLDCQGLNSVSCVAANQAAAHIDSALGFSLIQPTAGPARYRTEVLYTAFESIREAAVANGCDLGAQTFEGTYGGRYGRDDWSGPWSTTDAASTGVAAGALDRSSNSFSGAFDGDLSGDLGDSFSAYNGSGQVASELGGTTFFLGQWIRRSGRKGVYAAVYGECSGDPGAAFSAWFDGGL